MALLAACAEKKTETAAATGAGPRRPPSTSSRAARKIWSPNVGDRVFFDFDKSILKHATTRRRWTSRRRGSASIRNVNVQIAGNCDERGTEEYNLALGQRRANAARDYLVAKGAAAARITTISYGKDRPQPDALGHDEASWAQNRNAITSVK